MTKFLYGNYGNYHGKTIGEMMSDAKQYDEKEWKPKYEHASDMLIDIIGKEAWSDWYDETIPDSVSTFRELTGIVEHELLHFECSCNPVVDPCLGCRNRAEATQIKMAHEASLTDYEEN